STSGERSALWNTCPRPVRTLVAVTNKRIGDSVRREKSTLSARISRSGVGALRVHVVGREQAGGKVVDDVGRRVVERPAPQQHVERRAAEGAELRRPAHALPEALERGLGAGSAAVGVFAARGALLRGFLRRTTANRRIFSDAHLRLAILRRL